MQTGRSRPNLSLRGLALAVVLALALLPGQARAQDGGPGTEDPNNWPQYHRTGNGWRYSPLDQINKENVGRLHVAWINQAGEITGGRQDTPIVVDGVIYTMTAGTRVAAIDARTGKDIWQYELKLASEAYKSFPTRGVTVGRGKVFVA